MWQQASDFYSIKQYSSGQRVWLQTMTVLDFTEGGKG